MSYTQSGVALDPMDPERVDLFWVCRQWAKAFKPYFEETKLDRTSQRYLGALQLDMYFRMFEILIPTSSSQNETIYDDFIQHFRYIVSSSRHLIERSKTREGLIGPKVQFGMGLIMPLYITAIKCRDYSLRREAIALLQNSPCRNGVWDSVIVAKVAAWVVTIEEDGWDYDGCVPEELRIRGGSLTFYIRSGWVIVNCLQGLVSTFGRLRKRTADLSIS
ncbi:hypothetical protein B0O99DRAFT_312263 [Bisporella sp. PMI_857]|nr:hypothetical protein B0O99DRAFT_312263 [Bisporella sp. PMI_857]